MIYTLGFGGSANAELDRVLAQAGIVLDERLNYNPLSRLDTANGVRIEAKSSECWMPTRGRRLEGIQLFVTNADGKKTIRRVQVQTTRSTEGTTFTLDLTNLKAKFEELKAMVPGIEAAKKVKQEEYDQDRESRDKAKVVRMALQAEVDELVHPGDFELHRTSMEDAYTATLRGLSTSDVRWLAACKRELAGWR